MKRRLRIDIAIVPHKEQRYETCGDWWWEGNTLNIRVSRMDGVSPLLVALHEAVEAILCRETGVKARDVTAFDVAYEKAREDGGKAPCGCEIREEPGDDPHACYGPAHKLATRIERMLADYFGLKWRDHNARVNALFE